MSIPNFTFRTLVISSAVWGLCWILLQTLVLYYSAGFTIELSLRDAITTNVFLAFACYVMITITRFYQPRHSLQLIWSIGLSVGTVLLALEFNMVFFPEDSAHILFVQRTFLIRSLFAWLVISLVSLMSYVWFYIREQQEIEERKTDMEKMAREAELSKLRQQLQPHFLFNSLNSISALAGVRPEEARNMIQQLSDFLRGTIKRDDQQQITLEEELKHLQLYLEIEKVRFGYRLKTEIIKDENTLKLTLPALLLQPLLENAIKFGLYDTTGEVTIRLRAILDDNQLLLIIENPFDPVTTQPKHGTGFGLPSVQRRLYLLYARQDLLQTKQEGNTFITTVRIPQIL